jgi:hypothetical protein
VNATGRIAVFVLAGAACGAAATAATIVWRPAAAAPLLFGLLVVLGVLTVVGSPGHRAGRATLFVGLTGVVAVLLVPFLGALGLGEPVRDLIGVVGAVAALVTLVLVQRQIAIAQDQVAIAQREIKLVEEDLAYSREQSEFTRAQVAELTRRPRLTVAFAGGEHQKMLSRIRGRHMFSADLLVHNGGDRTARDAYIEILIPWSVLDHEFTDEQILHQPSTEEFDGVAHRRYGKQVSEPIYRDLDRPVSVFSEALILNPESFTLRWRLRDDFGAYPEDERWGRLEVRVPPEPSTRGLQFTRRWDVEPHPMLGWDRTGRDHFVYASLAPDEVDRVAVIDEALQHRIEDVVWSMPGLNGTAPNTGQIGVEFTLGDRAGPLSGADTNEIAAAQAYERGRHRCYVRADGAIEVRLPQERGQPVFEVLRVLAATYAIARALNRNLSDQPRARGRLSYKLRVPEGLIGSEDERFIEMSLVRDDFVEYVTPLVMSLQRAGGVAPVESETRRMVGRFWDDHPGSRDTDETLQP